MNLVKIINFAILVVVSTIYAAQYEAENAKLSGDAKSVHSNSASNGSYAQMNGGTITFDNINVDAAGKYLLKIRYSSNGHRANYIKVNGAMAMTMDFDNTNGFGDATTVVTLKAGKNSIAIDKYWGWMDVDYIDVSKHESKPFEISPKPVTPDATESLLKLYGFLHENFGKKTISGIMTGDMSRYSIGADFRTHDDVKDIYDRSGKYPALVGVDFLFASGPNAKSSWNMEYTNKGISLVKDLWKKGGIPNFTWHWKDPRDKNDAFYTPGSNDSSTDFNLSEAFVSGTTNWNKESAAYKGIIADIDFIADFFLDLQKEGVAGIFRPLHEAGGSWFWWSARSGMEFAALYRLVFDRMVKEKGVKNMVWVFNPIAAYLSDWNPGEDYYDVLSIDIYNSGYDYSSNTCYFEDFKDKLGVHKILALSENGSIPDVNNMHTDEAVWSWWMPWYGTWGSTWPAQTSNEMWKSNMNDPRIITIEDMPGWDKYTVKNEEKTTAIANVKLGATEAASEYQIFDVRGVHLGNKVKMEKLSQGHYIIRSKMQGRSKSRSFVKK